MNTPTPRTDAVFNSTCGIGNALCFARQLERELAEAKAENLLHAKFNHELHGLKNEQFADLMKAEAANADLRAQLAKFDDPQCLHAYCVRHLTQAQVAHLFGERMTEIVNERDALKAECENQVQAKLDLRARLTAAEQERDAAKDKRDGVIQKLHESYLEKCMEADTMHQHHKNAETALAAARLDSERLDWLLSAEVCCGTANVTFRSPAPPLMPQCTPTLNPLRSTTLPSNT